MISDDFIKKENDMEQQVEFRPLFLVERLTEELGVSISYVYDDLVFMEHGDVLLQFDAVEPETINIYINSNIHIDDIQSIEERWQQVAMMKKVSLVNRGTFTVEQIPGVEEINIQLNGMNSAQNGLLYEKG